MIQRQIQGVPDKIEFSHKVTREGDGWHADFNTESGHLVMVSIKHSPKGIKSTPYSNLLGAFVHLSQDEYQRKVESKIPQTQAIPN